MFIKKRRYHVTQESGNIPSLKTGNTAIKCSDRDFMFRYFIIFVRQHNYYYIQI